MKDFHALFSDRDFEKMTVNVMKEQHPSEMEFFRNKESFFNQLVVDRDLLIKYICLFYDPRSPLQTKLPDHIDRKKAAAVIAGFKPKNNVFAKEVQGVLYCTDKETNNCIVEYLRSLRSPTWTYLCANWESYHKVVEDMMNDASTMSEKGSTKTSVDIAFQRTKLATQAKIMHNDLNETTLQFLSQDSSPYLSAHLFDLIEKERVIYNLSPERASGIEV